MTYCNIILVSFILCVFHGVNSISLKEPQVDNIESGIYEILQDKKYLPSEKELSKSTIMKTDDNDSTYILSKLSDEELVKLLSQEPNENKYQLHNLMNPSSQTEQGKSQKAYFRLDDQEVEPFNYSPNANPNLTALQKLNNMLYSRPQLQSSTEDDKKNEMLFDVLVAQLKALCCKKRNSKTTKPSTSIQKELISKKWSHLPLKSKPNDYKPTEHIFLVVNDEINIQDDTDDLIAVDPESLSKNSNVLVLGPITTPLSDLQLKHVIARITNELSRPEYLSLLRKISEGSLRDNLNIAKSLISGPDSRRYIKPHRCNHQSKLARIYGGPKWLICTGYLNVNTPSLYD